MLEPAGDLGLEQEALPARRVVGVVVEDLLERHLTIELGVHCNEHGRQAAAGVGAEDAKAWPSLVVVPTQKLDVRSSPTSEDPEPM